ncbi:Hypothetical predicted protein [Pelobates cultripes]|uniref:Uncharacterized protein n=1 Tax=Pelobates cultripes TaxID=61616 RepID=A0AAD1WEG7_PELCU|nr:Hypothetical predicted protein [Pelobates cultripes]
MAARREAPMSPTVRLLKSMAGAQGETEKRWKTLILSIARNNLFTPGLGGPMVFYPVLGLCFTRGRHGMSQAHGYGVEKLMATHIFPLPEPDREIRCLIASPYGLTLHNLLSLSIAIFIIPPTWGLPRGFNNLS